MQAFALDSTGDLSVAGKMCSLVSGQAAIVQKVRIGLRTIVGEWFADLRYGVPYYTNILVKNPNSAQIVRIFKQLILSCDGVTAVNSISLQYNPATRSATLTYDATIDNGTEIPVNDSFVLSNPQGNAQ